MSATSQTQQPASSNPNGVAVRCQKLTRYLGEGEGRVHVLR